MNPLPTEEPESEYIEYQEILVTYSPADVAFLKSFLDAEDIAYYFQGEYVAPYVYHAIPVRLLVRIDHVEKAIELLRDFETRFSFNIPPEDEDNVE